MHTQERDYGIFQRYLPLVAILVMVMLLSACLPPTVSQTKLPELLNTRTQGATDQVVELTTIPVSTPTSAPESGCTIPPGSPPMPDLSASFGWAPQLQEYLNQGGLVEPLVDVLESTPSPHGAPAMMSRRDLTGDGLEDLIVTLYDGTQQAGLPSGALLIFRCAKGIYQLAYSTTPTQNHGPPVLRVVQDLNADGVAEILYTREACGAHTCSIQVEILRWERSGFINLFEGRADDLPSPDLQITGPTNDARYRIEITARGIASAGAGPYRQMTRIWQWSTETSKFVPVEERLAPPSFRIHMLHDADDAASVGNIEAALIMFQRVREDETLDDWIKGDAGYAQLAGFATYRQMTIYIQQSHLDDAEQALRFLQKSNPEGSPGFGMRLLAEAYWEAYRETNDPQAACTIAKRFAQQHPIEVLEALQYGYANRIYTAGDVCPPAQ